MESRAAVRYTSSMNEDTRSATAVTSKKKLIFGGIGVVVAVALVTGILVFVAGVLGRNYQGEVASYVKRSAAVLKSKDVTDTAKVRALVDSAPKLAWVPFGNINGDYQKARAKAAAVRFYADKTTTLVIDKRDKTFRDKLRAIVEDRRVKYNDNVKAQSENLKKTTRTFTNLKKVTIAYEQKMIDDFRATKASIDKLPANSFAAPIKEYAILQTDRMIALFEAQQAMVKSANDPNIVDRINVTNVFKIKAQMNYFARLSPTVGGMYYYGWAIPLQSQMEKYLGDKPFTGDDATVKAKASLAYDADIYKRFIPVSSKEKLFSPYSDIARYQAYLMKKTLESDKTPQAVKKAYAQNVDRVYADSLTITEHDDGKIGLTAVVYQTLAMSGSFESMTAKGKYVDEAKKIAYELLDMYTMIDYYRPVTSQIVAKFKQVIDIKSKVVLTSKKQTEIVDKASADFQKVVEHAEDGVKDSASFKMAQEKIEKARADYAQAKKEAGKLQAQIDTLDDEYTASIRAISELLNGKLAPLQNDYSAYRKSLIADVDRFVESLR